MVRSVLRVLNESMKAQLDLHALEQEPVRQAALATGSISSTRQTART